MSNVDKLLAKFHEAATNPKKQLDSYLKNGKKVIGCVPVYTPEEVIHSFGYVPFGVWGADVQIKEAKRYFPAFICSIMQSILELGINGEYKGMSAIVIPSLCDSLKSVGQNWKYAVKDIPFIPMTYPQNRKCDSAKDFLNFTYGKVIKNLSDIDNIEFDDKKLAKSIEVYNKHNAAMRRFQKLLSEKPVLTAVERKDVYKSAYFMLKEEHTDLVEELNEYLANAIYDGSKTRVVTSGILADNENLLKIFDENNLTIVADDIAHESRQYRTDAPQSNSALDSLVEKFRNMDNCSVLFNKDKVRANYVVNLAKENNAAGVLMIMTKFCDPEEFDYVIIKKELDNADIPSLQVEIDRQMVNFEQANTMIQAFGEVL